MTTHVERLQKEREPKRTKDGNVTAFLAGATVSVVLAIPVVYWGVGKGI